MGGRGLFRSEFVLVLDIEGSGVNSVASNSEKDTVCGARGLTSFPCRCRGAGGGVFFSGFLACFTKPCVSSSDRAISKDVRGVSWCGSWREWSKIDWRETDEVSVLLLSKAEGAFGAVAGVTVVFWVLVLEPGGDEMPVMSSLLKPSTSRLLFGTPRSL